MEEPKGLDMLSHYFVELFVQSLAGQPSADQPSTDQPSTSQPSTNQSAQEMPEFFNEGIREAKATPEILNQSSSFKAHLTTVLTTIALSHLIHEVLQDESHPALQSIAQADAHIRSIFLENYPLPTDTSGRRAACMHRHSRLVGQVGVLNMTNMRTSTAFVAQSISANTLNNSS
ncbi:hypothetical protein HD806DRAFT_521993 [Xylariaceae sp. AK1471]|nr:hypothetical protein HD806DRAFT_521993 [Xylariaceae sp. AK1471]